MIHKKDVEHAYNIIDSVLEAIDSDHDCHASAEDGCDCQTIGFMRLDLAKIKSFILEHDNKE